MYNCPINHTLRIKDLKSSGCQEGTPNIIKYNKLINYSKIFTNFRQVEHCLSHTDILKDSAKTTSLWNQGLKLWTLQVRTVEAVGAESSNTLLQQRTLRATKRLKHYLFHAHAAIAVGLQAGLLAVREDCLHLWNFIT